MYPGQVVANIWDYDPMWKVEYLEDGKPAGKMERFAGRDPLAAECYKDPASLKRSWVYAAETENLFRAPLSPKARTIEIRATDRFGRTYTYSFSR